MYTLAQNYTALGDKRSALRVLRNRIERGFFTDSRDLRDQK